MIGYRRVLLLGLLLGPLGCTPFGAGEAALELVEGVPPVYPGAAKDEGVEGEVTLLYTVRADGRVTDVRVLEADPPGVFDEAAVTSVETWRYRPPRRGRETVTLENVASTLRFRLDEELADRPEEAYQDMEIRVPDPE